MYGDLRDSLDEGDAARVTAGLQEALKSWAWLAQEGDGLVDYGPLPNPFVLRLHTYTHGERFEQVGTAILDVRDDAMVTLHATSGYKRFEFSFPVPPR